MCILLDVYSENTWLTTDEDLPDKQELNVLWLFLHILRDCSGQDTLITGRKVIL